MRLKAIVAGTVFLCSATSEARAQVTFRPPEVVAATDAQSPIQSVADGIVVVDAAIDATGALTNTTVVRDIASLTRAAISSLQGWKFRPALVDGEPQASTMRIAFSFRPRSYLAADPQFDPLVEAESPGGNFTGFVPPGIVFVDGYPPFPINAASPGAVVIQVTVDTSGRARQLKVVRPLPPFTDSAVTAARKWHFQAATIDGRPVVSNVAIAFVFSSLVLNRPASKRR